MEVRDGVLKSLETARNEKLIGAPLEARVKLSANGDLFPLLEEYAAELPGLFIVSQVDAERRRSGALAVAVERASGPKCERCWKYTTMSAPIPRFPTVCASCAGSSMRPRSDESSVECIAREARQSPWLTRASSAFALAAGVFALDRVTKRLVERAFPSPTITSHPRPVRYRSLGKPRRGVRHLQRFRIASGAPCF